MVLCADNDNAKSEEILRKIEGVFQVENLDFRKGNQSCVTLFPSMVDKHV